MIQLIAEEINTHLYNTIGNKNMLPLAELVGRGIGVLQWFLPGIFGTLAILFMYGLQWLSLMPRFLFIGFFSFYLAWILPALAFAPAVVNRPIGGYSSFGACALACVVAIIISAIFMRGEPTRSKEYTSIIIGFITSVYFIDGLPSIT